MKILAYLDDEAVDFEVDDQNDEPSNEPPRDPPKPSPTKLTVDSSTQDSTKQSSTQSDVLAILKKQQKSIGSLQNNIHDLQTELVNMRTKVAVLEETIRTSSVIPSKRYRTSNPKIERTTDNPTEEAESETGANAVDAMQGIEAPVASSAPGNVIDTIEPEQTDTQEYLRSFRAEEPEDDDYDPVEDNSQSQHNDEPKTQAVSRSVERLLSPAKPAPLPFKATSRGGRRKGAGRPPRDRSVSTGGARNDLSGSIRRSGRPKKYLPDLSTPEWERPDWDPATYGSSPSNRGQNIVRRGVSGRPPGSLNKRTKMDSAFKQRDSEGYILAANGKRDGRSTRRGGRRSEPAPRSTSENGHTVMLGDELSSPPPQGRDSAAEKRHEKLMGKIFPGRYDKIMSDNERDENGTLPG